MDLKIGEVARRAGIAPSAIRYYESEGLLPAPLRHNGQRVYAADVVDHLALIELAQKAGFTIAEIKRLQAGFDADTPPGERWLAFVEAKHAELDARIAEARSMKRVLDRVAGCGCRSLGDCGREASCGGALT